MAPGRPSTWAMPSAASMTVPTSVVDARARLVAGDEVLEGAADLVRADGDVCHGVPFVEWSVAGSAGELQAKFGESGCDGAVDDVVADLHAQAADDGGVDRARRCAARGRTALRASRSSVSSCAAVSGAAAVTVATMPPDASATISAARAEQLADAAAARALHQVTDDREGAGVGLLAEQAVDERGLLGGVAELAADRELELGVARHGTREREQLGLDGASPVGAVGDRADADLLDAVDQLVGVRPACRRRASRAATAAAGSSAPKMRADQRRSSRPPRSTGRRAARAAATSRRCRARPRAAAHRSSRVTPFAEARAVFAASRATRDAEPITCPPWPSCVPAEVGQEAVDDAGRLLVVGERLADDAGREVERERADLGAQRHQRGGALGLDLRLARSRRCARPRPAPARPARRGSSSRPRGPRP